MSHHLCRIHSVMVNVCIHDECQPVDREEHDRVKARVAELEHVEDAVLACQKMVDANEPYAAIVDRLLTIYVGGAIKRALEKRTSPSVSDIKEEKTP